MDTAVLISKVGERLPRAIMGGIAMPMHKELHGITPSPMPRDASS